MLITFLQTGKGTVRVLRYVLTNIGTIRRGINFFLQRKKNANHSVELNILQIARDYGIKIEDRRSSKAKSTSSSQDRSAKQRLAREEAMLRAQQALNRISVPMSVPLGSSSTNGANSISDKVIVKSLGRIIPEYVTETKLHPIGYAAQWTDHDGAVFDCVIEDDQDRKRPVYIVYQDGKEVGRGEDPQAAWFFKGSPLPGWTKSYGTRRFGLASQTCLAALEGLEGVEHTKYVYVEQRSSWEEELLQILQLPQKKKRVVGSGSKPGKGKAEAGDKTAVAVAKVMENMLKQLELAESRALAKQRRQADKQKLKEEKKEEKMKEKRAAKELLKFQKAELRRAAGDVIKSAANAESLLLLTADENLPTARDAPPLPSPLLSSPLLPPSAHAALLQTWHLLHRFSSLFAIPDPSLIPSIPEIVSSLESGGTYLGAAAPACKPSSDNPDPVSESVSELAPALWVVIAMLRLLIDDLYYDAVGLIAESNDDVRESDFKPGFGKSSFPTVWVCALGTLGPESWQEACRRLFALVADATMSWERDGRNGVPAPLTDALDPFLVLEYLAAAPPTRLATGISALPTNAAPHAWHGIQATQHAKALALSRSTLFPTTTSESRIATQDWIRVQRYILHRLCLISFNKNDASCLFWQGQSASAAQKAAIPLDLRSLAARVDAGWYAENGVDALASDVMYVVNLHQSAASKTSSAFAEENEKTNVAEIGALVADEMETLRKEVEGLGVGGFLEQQRREISPELAKTLDDLNVPFCPEEGACVVCWDTEDQERLVECQTSAGPADSCYKCHTYCECSPSSADVMLSDRVSSYWSMAERLGKVAWGDWTPADRMDLLCMLCTLVTDAPPLREALEVEEVRAKDMRKELTSKRNQLKQLQHAASQQHASSLAEAPPPRELRDAVADRMAMESLVKKISQLEHELELIPPPRLDPLGLDRHWNRYWLVPAASLSLHPTLPSQSNSGQKPAPLVLIEYADGSGNVGLYDSPEAMGELIDWLNPRGVREKLLEIALRRARAEMMEMMEQGTGGASGRDGDATKPEQHKPEAGLTKSNDQAIVVKIYDENAGLDLLRERMLDFESGLPPGARHPALGGSQHVMETWRSRVADPEAVKSPTDFLAALVVLESSINPSHLRLYWKVWTRPAPMPSSAHLASAVWLRFNALKSATKMKVHLGRGVKDLMIKNLVANINHHHTRHTRRTDSDSKLTTKEMEDSLTTQSGQEKVRGTRRKRGTDLEDEEDASVATSPSKKERRQAIVNDDEEYARKLDAELNARAGRPARSSRLRNASSAVIPSRKKYRTSLRGAAPTRGYKEVSSSSEWGVNSDEEEGEEEGSE